MGTQVAHRMTNGMTVGSLAIVMLAMGLVSVSAQNPADVGGGWALTVDTEAGGTTTPSITLVQDGSELTGHYSSDTLGEADVTGSVDGNNVRFSFDAEAGGYALEVTYTGALQEDGTLSGTMSLGGFGDGTFTGKRR